MRFQAIEWGAATRAETGLAALAFEGLDMSAFSPLTISYQSMDCFIGYAEVMKFRVGAGVFLCLDTFLAPTATLVFTSGFDVSPDRLERYLES